MAERTCVVCRGKAEKKRLLRFVARSEDGKSGVSGCRVFIDVEQVLLGRAVYCHLQAACLTESKLNARIREILGSRFKPRFLVTAEREGYFWPEGEDIEEVLRKVSLVGGSCNSESSKVPRGSRNKEVSEQLSAVLEELKKVRAEQVPQHRGRVRIRL